MSRESIILASPDRKPFQLEEISSSVDQQSIVQQSVSILPSPSRSPGIFSSELVTTVPDSDSLGWLVKNRTELLIIIGNHHLATRSETLELVCTLRQSCRKSINMWREIRLHHTIRAKL